ncbi:MAG: HIT domain-containing protein [Candidatus Saccharimonadales bacterium]
MKDPCPFCIGNNLLRGDLLFENDLWYITNLEEGSINNAVMAITKRHILTPFEINPEEWKSLQAVIDKMKSLVDAKEQADGYNLGWNIQQTGGQNVAHAHLHLLGRYANEPLAGKGIRYAFKQPSNQR